jgi:outer membrane protein OmpA-like peptidoglycan-associated protein
MGPSIMSDYGDRIKIVVPDAQELEPRAGLAGRPMKPIHHIGRPALLLLLFSVGAWLIWFAGHNLSPHRQTQISFKAGGDTIAAQFEETPPPKPPESLPEASADKKEDFKEKNLPRLLVTGRGLIIETEPILFSSGASMLRDNSIPRLDRLVVFLKGKPDLKVEIVGYADHLGIEDASLKISAERAAVVMDYLIFQGIDSSRLQSKGMGSVDPVESNDTQLGRQANRRIEFRAAK